ncbi:MAG: sensor histidine kinase [Clostridia bacterium]|nr:sensor histidine kinase [Clostridia bacterium]
MSGFEVYYRTAFVFLRSSIAVLIFAQALEKRRHYIVRVVTGMLTGALLSYFALRLSSSYLGWLPRPAATMTGMLIVYLYVNLFTAVCYLGSLWSILLISASGYAAQDITGHLKSLALLLPGLQNLPVLWNILVDIALTAVIYVTVYLALERRNDGNQDYLNNRYKGILSALVLIICIGMGRITGDNTDRNLTAKVAENIYAILVSVLLLHVQYSNNVRAKLSQDVDTMRELLHVQRVQYEDSRESVQLVNEKYHDLNKMLSSLSAHVTLDQIEQVRQEVAVYDSQMHTGSEVLDVVLSEKRMSCNARGILLTCFVDGAILSFVDDLDLYALFGNLLSNAIEAVEELAEGMERFILVTVRKCGNMVTIHEENPCEGKVEFVDGLPVTRGDPQWHGFGMKSMQRIAEKYGGAISTIQKDGMFQLDILLFGAEETSL